MPSISKQNKVLYYLKGFYHTFMPTKVSVQECMAKLATQLSLMDKDKADKRVDYYCQLTGQQTFRPAQHIVADLKHFHTPKSYFFDTYEYARYFPANYPIDFLFGDVTTVAPTPSITKSRPIVPNNQNNVLLNLDKARHFVWVKDDIPFRMKKDLLIGRGGIYQAHRIRFYEQYFGHALCDLGQTNQSKHHPEWTKPKISIAEHLKYKFILSLQGNDVATNLKWIMSSNSIAVMPKPTMETWFMEGTLQGGVHYIEIRDDYADLEEVLLHYIHHPDECEQIIQHAQAYCRQFFNPILEDWCSFQVLNRYFQYRQTT